MIDATRQSRQGLARELTKQERSLAEALEAAFSAGLHEPGEVAARLNEMQIARPSGGMEPWSAAILLDELKVVNASLDAAYFDSLPAGIGIH